MNVRVCVQGDVTKNTLTTLESTGTYSYVNTPDYFHNANDSGNGRHHDISRLRRLPRLILAGLHPSTDADLLKNESNRTVHHE
jgi:hypothetical protein